MYSVILTGTLSFLGTDSRARHFPAERARHAERAPRRRRDSHNIRHLAEAGRMESVPARQDTGVLGNNRHADGARLRW